jgi:hypothetical protein
MPRSVLQDSLALKVLAMIEYKGLATEDALTEILGLDKQKLIAVLLDLHADKFISYGPSHIKVNERGKKVLDRFELSPLLLEDISDQFFPEASFTADFIYICSEYRNKAFAQYLNSVSTLHAWRTWSEQLFGSIEEHLQKAIFIVILTRDIENWYESPSAQHLSKETEHKRITKYFRSEEFTGDPSTDKNQFLKRTLEVVKTIQRSSFKSPAEFNPTVDQTEKLLSCFALFNKFQEHSALDTWFDVWTSEWAGQTKSGKPMEYTDVIEIISRLIRSNIASSSRPWSAWWGEPYISPLDRISLALPSATSIKDLSTQTGVQPEAVRDTLSRLRGKCEDILTNPQSSEESST